jgi:hypothetical protein
LIPLHEENRGFAPSVAAVLSLLKKRIYGGGRTEDMEEEEG